MTIRVSGKFLITFAQSANSDIQDPKSPNVEYQAPWPFRLGLVGKYLDTALQMQGTYTWPDPSTFTSSSSTAIKRLPDD